MSKFISFILLTLVLVSCGTDDQHFSIEGHLLNLNQGEFYVYSTDGAIPALDTIHVRAGRFSYETSCTSPGTLVIIFPNYSELPVFCEPGGSVSIKGSANHLRELTIKGNAENKLMQTFRELTVHMSPPETEKQVKHFVSDHPVSLAAIYLIQRYFLQKPIPEYTEAAKLLQIVCKIQPDNGRAEQLLRQINTLASSSINSPLPSFSVRDVNGNSVTSQSLSQGDAVIYLYASWDYESQAIMRILRDKRQNNPGLHLFGICIDASIKDCKKYLERDNITNPVFCDGKMLEGSLVHTLGFTSIPQNIILHNGKITTRNLTQEEIIKKFQ